jgi:hypothetical protein
MACLSGECGGTDQPVVRLKSTVPLEKLAASKPTVPLENDGTDRFVSDPEGQ